MNQEKEMMKPEKIPVDVEKIMQEIRSKIQAEELAASMPAFSQVPVNGELPKVVSTVPAEGENWEEFMDSIRYMNTNYEIPYYWSFGSAGIKTFAKRVVRKLAKCIIPPILAKQGQFNACVVRCMNTVRYFIEGQRCINDQLREENRQLKALLEGQEIRLQEIQHITNSKIDALEQMYQKQLRKVQSYTAGLEEQLQEVQSHTTGLEKQLQEVQSHITGLEEQINGVEVHTHTLDEQMAIAYQDIQSVSVRLDNVEVHTHTLDEQMAVAYKDIQSVSIRLDGVDLHVQSVDSHMQTLDRQSDAFSASVAKAILSRTPVAKAQQQDVFQNSASEQKSSGDRYLAIDYFEFQNQFRGTRSQITERQEMYLPYFKKSDKPVLDVGCGRGEFLHLMKNHGIQAFGVDLYPEYVVEGELNGLDIRQGDAIQFLKDSTQSFAGIFASQVIEHISFEQLQILCQSAYEKLEDGAYFILETPNPTCLSMFTSSFYIDPTHNKPIHPLTLEYILHEVGFQEVHIVYTQASRQQALPLIKGDGIQNLDEVNAAITRVSDMLYGSLDYAVIAKK